ncbi:hypothetical protein [Streptomyces albireticuli]|uniref:SpdB2 protein n=1 Tax=Streptomyces albireticuli TaxID=1940 RepID=A0A2A2D5G3_9ACTN|nr:hypothetical protein [Streptomyces albireticuli]MCD9196058.1 hypothetical protein [Streptomyces albireticuli]PAU46552.1 hypothetical protein CK936_23450 [Streptomyces albireticuli]
MTTYAAPEAGADAVEVRARALLAEAEANAIQARTQADVEARRVTAAAEADAIRLKAAEEAERQRIANERSAMRLEKEKAENAAKVAEANRRREEADRLAEKAREEAAQAKQAVDAEEARRAESATSWKRAALGFAIVCAVVALPVQMSAFYSPGAPWLLVAPLVLEGGAWVVLRGAAAAVDERRPHWHYRLIAWTLAFIAAGINFAHGLRAFDLATAAGTAFASLAGPGVWDLHEHGRIRVRDGKLTRAQRKEKRAAEKKAAAEKTAAETRAAEEKAAAEKTAKEAREALAKERAEKYPTEWEHALKLAAAIGQVEVTDAVWKRTWDELHAADPGVTVDVIRGRNAAARRVLSARSEEPGKTPVKVTSSQRVPHLPPTSGRGAKTGPKVRGVRRSGDAPRFVKAARTQASIAAKSAAPHQPG